MLEKCVLFLRKNYLLNILLILISTALILHLHNAGVSISVAIMNKLSLPNYNFWVKTIGIIIAIAIIIMLFVAIRKQRDFIVAKTSLLAVIMIAWLVHVSYMLEMNIEIIHGLLYGSLTFLFFTLTGRYAVAIICSIPVMMIDEWYQYQILYPSYVTYFEWNDVVLDILGGGITITILFFSNLYPFYNKMIWYKKIEVYLLPIYLFLLGFGLFTCYIAKYVEEVCGNTWIVLNKLENPLQFWQTHTFTKAVYHVLLLHEAVLLIVILCSIFYFLDYYLGIKNNKQKA